MIIVIATIKHIVIGCSFLGMRYLYWDGNGKLDFGLGLPGCRGKRMIVCISRS